MTSLLRTAAGWIFVGCASSAACALVGYDFDGYSPSGTGGSGGSDSTTGQGTGSSASSGVLTSGSSSASSGSGGSVAAATSSASASSSGTGSQPCLDVADCNDMNLCTTDVCSSGMCGHVPVTLNDFNACTTDGCDPSTGQGTHTLIDDCCPHSVCTSSVPLSSNCTFTGAPIDCVAEVCGTWPKCCTTIWDAECIANAQGLCNTTGQITCGCAHSYCVTGGPLNPTCDPCVEAICKINSACCMTAWDSACVFATHTHCHIPVGADCQ